MLFVLCRFIVVLILVGVRRWWRRRFGLLGRRSPLFLKVWSRKLPFGRLLMFILFLMLVVFRLGRCPRFGRRGRRACRRWKSSFSSYVAGAIVFLEGEFSVSWIGPARTNKAQLTTNSSVSS